MEKRGGWIADVLGDLMAICGVALVGYGAWLAWPPAGFIVPGAMLFGVAMIGTIRRRL